MKSGGDTTLAGAVVSGHKVKTDVGGDLNIITQQDTANYNETNTGGSLTIGTGKNGLVVGGGITQGTTTGNYVNTTEQSGFVAGAGGFDINVKEAISHSLP